MKFISNAFGSKKEKEDGIRSEILYADLSGIESELGNYVPKARKRVEFNHHDNLDFGKVLQDQKDLKNEFEEHGGDFLGKSYAVFNDSVKFSDFKARLVGFLDLFDADPRASNSEGNHYLIMMSNHQGFEGEDLLSLSEDRLRQALKAPFIMEGDDKSDVTAETDNESVSDSDDETSISANESYSGPIASIDTVEESWNSGNITDVDPRIGCYLIDMSNLNKQLDTIIENRPESKAEIDMFRELIDKAKENALLVARQLEDQKVLEEQEAQKTQEMERLQEAILIEEEKERREFEDKCDKYQVGDCVDKIAVGPVTQSILDGRQNEGRSSQVSAGR